MNFYVVVEGRVGEKLVYRNWIPEVNPQLSFVHKLADLKLNNFHIVSGDGYPNYFETIQNAIEDINTFRNVDRLVICVDSENDSYDDKYSEVDSFVRQSSCSAEIRIVVQHFCFETWALGNRKIGPRKHNLDEIVRKYKAFYNVLIDDPEGLPDYPEEDLNRSQFAVKYLRKLLIRKNGTYTKSNPSYIMNTKFFREIKSRHIDTDHIMSFKHFMDAFV